MSRSACPFPSESGSRSELALPLAYPLPLAWPSVLETL